MQEGIPSLLPWRCFVSILYYLFCKLQLQVQWCYVPYYGIIRLKLQVQICGAVIAQTGTSEDWWCTQTYSTHLMQHVECSNYPEGSVLLNW